MLLVSLGFGLGLVVDWICRTAGVDQDRAISSEGPVSVLSADLAESDASGSLPGEASPNSAITLKELLAMMGASVTGSSPSQTVDVYRRLSRLSAKELAALADQLETSPQDRRFGELRRHVFSVWAESDPKGVLDFAKASTNQQSREEMYPLVFRVLGDRAPEKVSDFLAEIENPQFRALAIKGFACSESSLKDPRRVLEMIEDAGIESHWQYGHIFGDWVSRDPSAAIAAFEKLPSQAQGHAVRDLVREWASDSPEAALAWAQKLNGRVRSTAVTIAFELLAMQDPASAVAAYQDLRGGEVRTEVLGTIAGSYFRVDPERASEWLQQLDGAEYVKALSGGLHAALSADPSKAAEIYLNAPMCEQISGHSTVIANQLARMDTEKAVAWVEKLPRGRAQLNALSGLMQRWGSEDPEAAATYLETFGVDTYHVDVASNLVRSWAVEDAAGAKEWVLSQDSVAVQRELVRELTSALAEADSAEAIAFVDQIEDVAMRDRGAAALIPQLAYHDPEAALGWILQNRGEESPRHLSALLTRLAHHDSQRALEIFENHLNEFAGEDSQSYGQAVSSIASALGHSAPREAVNWALGLPSGSGRDHAIGMISESWIRNDPMGASQWIGELPAGQMKDQAIQPLVSNLQRDDPEAAFVWALAASDPNRRNDLISSVVSQWMRHDADGAIAAIRRADLPEDVVRQILPPLDE